MKRYISIIAALLFSFFIVLMMTPQIFLHNTPDIDPQFIAKLKDLPTTVKDTGKTITLMATNLFSGKKGGTPQPTSSQDVFGGLAQKDIPTDLVFSPITKGVAAAEDSETKKKYVHLDKDTPYHFEDTVINGVTYKVVRFD